ncbi:ATP-dependent zinc protease [Pseudomonas sp. DNDY-54]|uniref:retropepsin-like aspartic peptidase RloA n=1 Tax=Pseudomonas sp. DNDY-54 TaxID=2870860 RepID=UPI001CA3D5BA|nr:ATP-dependent zinc protease [Pseudomonas sp. DNDY-54]
MSAKPCFLLLCALASPLLVQADEKTIYGLNEHIALPDFGLEVPAKLDTGAQTASLSARDIERFKRDGKPWVRFYLAIDEAHDRPIELPLQRISKIKRRAGDFDPEEEKTYTPRPVVELELCMGNAKRSIEVNLTDRSAFQYPLLIGSDALTRFEALVDPSLKYAAGKPGCIIESDADE